LSHKFNKLLENDFIYLDGAMGTMLQETGIDFGAVPGVIGIKHSEVVAAIHKMYVDAGADIIYANTFGANRFKLKDCGHSLEEVINADVGNARKAAEGTDVLVALDLGPTGKLIEPSGSMTFEEAYDTFKEIVLAGVKAGADLIVIETMSDLYETKAAVLAAKENSDLPVLCTMTFEENGRTFTGVPPSSMALTLEGLGIDGIGINCSLGPKEMFPVIEELCRWTVLPVIVKPNAGLPDPATGRYDITPEEFVEYMLRLIPLGVKIVGGCCGTTPGFIRQLRESFQKMKYIHVAKEIPAAICSGVSTVIIDQPRIIGERINPTGKKTFREALVKNDISYILGQAIEQVKAGADILDVNVGTPEIDEKMMMTTVIKALQGVVTVPLQIDSSDPAALEAGLRAYNGKAIVNSVNGEEKSMAEVLPLVKKYGAAVVGLTLDEQGIPATAENRFQIAKRIMDRALAEGIKKENVFIDCLTLTASAEQAKVMDTVRALRRVKEDLGLKTVLGVSNVSFGLPNRPLINHNFLTMALAAGLDLPIINPNDEEMTGAVRAYKLLANLDKDALQFIETYKEYQPRKDKTDKSNFPKDIPAEQAGLLDPATGQKPSGKKMEIDLDYAIENGLKDEGVKITEKLLETVSPMVIVDQMLIPALDKAGANFESGEIFLPQLLLSAGVAQGAFDLIKAKLAADSNVRESKGKIVLATVKGDIHDIGKNIVKVLLENYGYQVIDLGKDVDPQKIVEAVIREDVKLVGLSALMTTTLKSMEQTIALLKKNDQSCSVMVGGAVLTAEYSAKMGADYYARDAKEAVDIAKSFFNPL